MNATTEGAGTQAFDQPSRSLGQFFDQDAKRFEWLAKQYYDLFAYHAAQRLTAFNFFIVSLSFFSNAYATLITRGADGGRMFLPVASALGFAAWLLVIAFGRLDKRNEQIIRINEEPLKRIQKSIREGMDAGLDGGDEVWETFMRAERSYPFRTFGQILPFIYSLAASACAAGGAFALTGPGDRVDWRYVTIWAVLSAVSSAAIYFPLGRRRTQPPIARFSAE